MIKSQILQVMASKYRCLRKTSRSWRCTFPWIFLAGSFTQLDNSLLAWKPYSHIHSHQLRYLWHTSMVQCALQIRLHFANNWEKIVQIPGYIQPQVVLIDFMLLIRCRKDLPPTVGGIAQALLHTACQVAEEVHIICDTNSNEPSIKDYTRQIHGASDHTYHISGPAQRCPADFSKALQSKSFKTSLINFLAN